MHAEARTDNGAIAYVFERYRSNLTPVATTFQGFALKQGACKYKLTCRKAEA